MTLMLQLCLIFLFVRLLAVSWKIVGSSLAANLVGLSQWLVCLVVGGAGGWLAGHVLWHSVRNFVLGYLLASAVGLGTFVLFRFLLGRRARRGRWAEACTAALRLPRWLDRAAGLLLVMAIWTGVFVAVDLLATFRRVADAPQDGGQYADAARSRGVGPDSGLAAAAQPPEDDGVQNVRGEMLLQDDFFHRLGHGVERSKQRFYSAIGADDILQQVRAVQQINALADEDRAWLVRQNPKLARLTDHPAMRRIARNDALLDKLQHVGEGSLPALYEVGDDPDVRELLDDPKVLLLARQVDPVAMMRQVRRHWQDSAAGD